MRYNCSRLQVFLVGRVVDAEKPDVLYTEAEALFVCKEVPSSNALVESVQQSVHAAVAPTNVVETGAPSQLGGARPKEPLV